MFPSPRQRSAFLPSHERAGIALCLSGGGFRAGLFHLGAVRRLYEVGVLDRVRTIASVSGGSQIAVHLANTHRLWHNTTLDADQWDRAIAAPFRAFTHRNLSTWPVLKGWLLPWTNAGIEAMATRLRARLQLQQQSIDRLPVDPRFMFCATDLVAGNDWLFDASMEGQWDIATAAAISACHPVYFRPYTKRTPQKIALVDGGVDDDRGIEPVWRTHQTLLVSDGGDALRPQWGQSLFWSLFRSASVLWDRSQVVQKRWLMSNFAAGLLAGAYWDIGGSPSDYQQGSAQLVPSGIDVYERVAFAASSPRVSSPDVERSVRAVAGADPPLPGYSPALARDVIAAIRTDCDAFSPAEAAVLENHGYLMTDAAMRSVAMNEYVPAPVRIPHPAWIGERKVREALKDSGRQKFFGRF